MKMDSYWSDDGVIAFGMTREPRDMVPIDNERAEVYSTIKAQCECMQMDMWPT
jgi:hypothetical protein